MTDKLITNFVDASEVQIEMNLEEKRIELEAYDEKTRSKYHLKFINCTTIKINYSNDEDPDLYNLTDGIIESETTSENVRNFEINFSDESVIKIGCRYFSIEKKNKII